MKLLVFFLYSFEIAFIGLQGILCIVISLAALFLHAVHVINAEVLLRVSNLKKSESKYDSGSIIAFQTRRSPASTKMVRVSAISMLLQVSYFFCKNLLALLIISATSIEISWSQNIVPVPTIIVPLLLSSYQILCEYGAYGKLMQSFKQILPGVISV